jgi:hypothetical protein
MLEAVPPFVPAIMGAVTVSLLARHGLRAKPDRDGWHRIKPAPMHWFALFGTVGFVAFMLYVRLFVGSSRPDAESQMFTLSCLIAAFTIGAVVVFWQMRRTLRSNVFWRYNTLCFTTPSGHERLQAMTEVVDIRELWTGWVVLRLRDSSTLRLDGYALGVPELCERIEEARNDWEGY